MQWHRNINSAAAANTNSIHRPCTGFTIIELITVMVIMGILSIGTVRFINDGSNGFAASLSRAAMVSDAQLLVTRLSREIREALPNSVRVSATGDCLELIPTLGASVYLSAPIGAQASSMQVVPMDSITASANPRVAIAPTATLYALSDPGSISPVASLSAPNASNEVTVSFASNFEFTQGSAQNRFYLVASPISYCRDGGALWRYQNYGFNAVQPNTSTLPGSAPNRALLAESIDSTSPIFDHSSASLRRNASVAVNLHMVRSGEELRIDHIVQTRNMP